MLISIGAIMVLMTLYLNSLRFILKQERFCFAYPLVLFIFLFIPFAFFSSYQGRAGHTGPRSLEPKEPPPGVWNPLFKIWRNCNSEYGKWYFVIIFTIDFSFTRNLNITYARKCRDEIPLSSMLILDLSILNSEDTRTTRRHQEFAVYSTCTQGRI